MNYDTQAPPFHYRANAIRIKHQVVPFSTASVAPGEYVTLHAQAHVMFRPGRLVIPRCVGRHLHVTDIKEGNVNLMGGAGEIHALAFRETLTEKVSIRMNWGTMSFAGPNASLTLKNVGKVTTLATAHLLGYSPEH